MRTVLVGFLAIATVATVLFFGLGGGTGPEGPIVVAISSTTAAPGAAAPTTPEAADPDAEPTLVAVTTTRPAAPTDTAATRLFPLFLRRFSAQQSTGKSSAFRQDVL